MRYSSSLVLAALAVATSTVSAQSEAPIQDLYVPLPEPSLLEDIFDQIESSATSPITTLISVAASTDGTIIYYDHWEDGYDSDPTGPGRQATTEVWGDGDISNGCAPGNPCNTDADDVFNAGDVAVMENAVPLPRDTSQIKYDGGDLVRATRACAMTRAAYPAGPGSLMAGAVEVIEASNWGTSFTAPVGQDTGNTQQAYEYVTLACMAEQPGTKLFKNGQQVATLGQGEGKVIPVNQGDEVTSSAPIQVHMITGDPGSTYELRWYSLTPTDEWSNEAYAPVGDTKGEVKVTVYNPSNSAITVTCTTPSTSYDITVPAKSEARSEIIPDGNAAKFHSEAGSPFFAFSSTDTFGNGQIYDWGYPLMTREQLTNIVLVGLGFGCTGNNCGSENERSVVWVTPVDDATIYVDYNNDGTVDETITATALQSIVLKDDDKDMSGAVIWATHDNGSAVDLAAAWGQKASLSGSNDQKALDLGTVIVPFEPVRTSCSVEIIIDGDSNGKMSVGDTVKQTIEVINSGPTAIGSGTLAVNTLGGIVQIDPTDSRGGVNTYEIEYVIPEGVDVNADICEIVPYVPPTPSPSVATPSPTVSTPAPTESTPAPTESTPAPTESTPAPTESTPAPTESTPAPTDSTPVPRTPPPQTLPPKTPAPTASTPAPTASTPAPTESEPEVEVCRSSGDGTDSYVMVQIAESAVDKGTELFPGDKITIDGAEYTLTDVCALERDATPAPTESTPAPTESPKTPPPKIPAPTGQPKSGPTDPPAKGSGSGDPHFKTWTGDKYDYHGECDLVLVNNPEFNNGQGLRVHIRTTRIKYFSFIEKIAIQIGKDVLEFDNDVKNFLINGKAVPESTKHHKTMLGGFVVRRDPRALSIRMNDRGSDKTHKNAKIDLHTRKNGFPAVIVDAGHVNDIFKGSLGLLGEYGTGRKLARDGKTEIPMDSHDATAFALEWQVRNDEPQLFKDARFPQFPAKCTPPAPMPARLGTSLMKKEAEEACSHWEEDMDDCIFDVMATRDVLVAEEGHIVHIE